MLQYESNNQPVTDMDKNLFSQRQFNKDNGLERNLNLLERWLEGNKYVQNLLSVFHIYIHISARLENSK